jgi:hypothetical protein
VQPGDAYIGNWTIGTPGTSAADPVTIEAAPGLAAAPVISRGNATNPACVTASCSGTVLTIDSGEDCVSSQDLAAKSATSRRDVAIFETVREQILRCH